MVRWRFLLRPGWIALTLVVTAFAVASFVLLAPWQFGRGEDRDARNDAIERSFTEPVVPVRELLPAGQAPGIDTEWRQVELTGRYLPDAETVVRLRSVQGEPAYEIVVPFELADGTRVLVDRGYVRPAEGVRLPDYPTPPSGEVSVTGRLRADETRGDRAPAEQDGITQIYSVSTDAVTGVTGVRLEPGYVQLGDGAPGVLSALPLPQLTAGPHLAYALQWLAFGVMAPLGLVYFAWREATGWRARDDEERGADDPHDPPVPTLADRYGR